MQKLGILWKIQDICFNMDTQIFKIEEDMTEKMKPKDDNSPKKIGGIHCSQYAFLWCTAAWSWFLGLPDDHAKMTTSAGWRWETVSGSLMDQEAALRTRPHLQTSEHWGLCGALRPQVRTPQMWPPGTYVTQWSFWAKWPSICLWS